MRFWAGRSQFAHWEALHTVCQKALGVQMRLHLLLRSNLPLMYCFALSEPLVYSSGRDTYRELKWIYLTGDRIPTIFGRTTKNNKRL